MGDRTREGDVHRYSGARGVQRVVRDADLYRTWTGASGYMHEAQAKPESLLSEGWLPGQIPTRKGKGTKGPVDLALPVNHERRICSARQYSRIYSIQLVCTIHRSTSLTDP